MLSTDLYLAYVLACFLATASPGPTVTLIVSNGLTYGVRAGLLNALGSQLALALMLVVVTLGLATVIEVVGEWFDWLRIAGALYLVWLGWRLWRSAPEAAAPASRAPARNHFTQGFFLMLANPKALLFFGAFIPQFIDPQGAYMAQVVLLGLTAMAIGLATDSTYAIVAGRAGRLVARHVRLVSKASGAVLIATALWLAFARARPA